MTRRDGTATYPVVDRFVAVLDTISTPQADGTRQQGNEETDLEFGAKADGSHLSHCDCDGSIRQRSSIIPRRSLKGSPCGTGGTRTGPVSFERSAVFPRTAIGVEVLPS